MSTRIQIVVNLIFYFLYGLGIFLIVIVALLLGAALTGHEARAYTVLELDDLVTLGEDEIPVYSAVDIYKPRMYLRSTTPSPPLLWMWYEVIPTKETYEIVYYYVWENEIHPNLTLHRLYALFRTLYYGYPLYDIEYFQISVARSDGSIRKIRFETNPVEDYFVTISEHNVANYVRQSNNVYDEYLTSQDGVGISHQLDFPIRFEEKHVLAGVQTWNHLTRLLSDTDDDFDQLMEAPIKYLTDEEYSKYKFVRKSQGDHRTDENRWSLLLVSLINFLLIGISAKVISGFARKKDVLL